ncbi:hypothetical protein [Pseudobacteroides cellulosolvens]|uniref:hypothetical protein n=1 Tax=Pseudobacteroides cellulosolvens TaxID=35825 RepID=UPI001A9A5DD2|nr:hypothetical protein [Pseudobacteroides cellulosolvens]
MALIMGFCALKGYYFFKGQLGAWTKWIISFSVIIAIAIAQPIIILLLFVQNGIPITGENLHNLFSNSEFLKATKSNLILTFFMAFLGTLPILLELKSNPRHFVPSLKKNLKE